MNKELDVYLIHDITNIVQDYLRPSIEQGKYLYSQVIRKIRLKIWGYDIRSSFSNSYFVGFIIDREIKSKSYFEERLNSGELILHYNPWREDKSLQYRFNVHYEKVKFREWQYTLNHFVELQQKRYRRLEDRLRHEMNHNWMEFRLHVI
jgi:hypothetical protein